MKWIVITLPDFIDNEATYINHLFEQGIDLLHLRKPNSPIEVCEQLIQEIDKKWHSKIVVHEHFDLCKKFHLHGIHLNRRNHEIPKNFKGSISRSCHSLEEVKEALAHPKGEITDAYVPRNFDYVFLSPIFDSISKQGYRHAFTDEILTLAAKEGIVNEKVIALGGITDEKIPQLKAWNFGGAAFLGDIWRKILPFHDNVVLLHP